MDPVFGLMLLLLRLMIKVIGFADVSFQYLVFTSFVFLVRFFRGVLHWSVSLCFWLWRLFGVLCFGGWRDGLFSLLAEQLRRGRKERFEEILGNPFPRSVLLLGLPSASRLPLPLSCHPRQSVLIISSILLALSFLHADAVGKLVGFTKITRDMTERHLADKRIIADYEEASKLKSQFLANMSHEIR